MLAGRKWFALTPVYTVTSMRECGMIPMTRERDDGQPLPKGLRQRLYGAPAAFTSGAGFLHGATPEVLRLSSQELRLPFTELRGPPSLGGASGARAAKFFNPSIVRSPPGLCERCAWVASIRVDTLHQW